ncbi:MAG: hypothetical protein SGJ19_18085 [Planctomycetia bacterium]|nr:hypothetical protein [Planctomycetia bacterium]
MNRFVACRQLLAVSLLVFLGGCGGASEADYIPETEAARQSLVAALDAWKAGQKPDPIHVGEIEVRIEDSIWRKGAKLRAYEIVAEPAVEGPRKFSVKLTLDRPPAPQTVDYYVVGKAPYWVFRDADYNRSNGM